ncbi:hypothetical protein RhiJN_24516 [Ceratobasidium sp. AG-Ba]|nr:hypothetical protein RhiJN_24516 [Ceratobasidium sp. AG-Ba]
MASQQTTGNELVFRHRIQGIQLDPQKSNYDIAAEIQADGTRVCKLPRIEKGQKLEWNDIYALCEVHDGSLVRVQVTEVHLVNDRVGRAEYRISRDTNVDSLSIACTSGKKTMFIVHIRIMGKKAADQAYTEALVIAEGVLKQRTSTRSPSAVSEAFNKMMELNNIVVELDPTGGAKAAFSVCVKAWEQFEDDQRQSATFGELLENLTSMIPTMESVEKFADPNLRTTLLDMQRLIEDVSVFILNVRSRSRSERVLYNMLNPTAQERSEFLKKRSKLLRKEFQERMAAQNLRSGELDRLREKLKELNPVKLANYDPSKICLDGTRTGIINDLMTWSEKEDEARRFAWVHGPAGIGKSSIMGSICKRLDELSQLGSSFFCKRDTPDLRDPRKLMMTLVCELAQHWDEFGSALAHAITRNINLESKHLERVYEILVVEPYRKIAGAKQPNTLVLAIDALDECGDLGTRQQLLKCLRDMSQLIPFLRLVVASRPNDDIRACFGSDGTDWYSEFNLLQYDASIDIRLFIDHSMSRLASVEGWPPDAVDQITTRANGMFIWARTACTYILSGVDKLKRLKMLTEGRKLDAIDALYEKIMTAKETFGDEENEEEMRRCLGTIVMTSMRSPLSVASLARLMGGYSSQEALQGTVDRLAAVMYLDQQLGGEIRISHPSFMDYITDPTRSKGLCVNPEEENRKISDWCLQTMRRELMFNMCGLETSDQLNRDIPDLHERVASKISHQLTYACLYWSIHLPEVATRSLNSLLREFLFGPELMYWLETLSLIGKLSAAPPSLLRVVKWCIQNDLVDCRIMANDAYRFVLAFYEPICASTPHLYISALAMAPSNSSILNQMRILFPNLLDTKELVGAEWTSCIRTISVGRPVCSVGVSPAGNLIISGCEDGTIHVWDAETGEAAIKPFLGHSGPVKCVTFSPDTLCIISGSSDCNIRVWDAKTGNTLIGPLTGHSGGVNAISCSYDSSLIASGSDDCTIHLWGAKTGESLFGPMAVHSRSVLCVAFSADNRMVASGSLDGTIQLWDVQNGSPILKPLVGRTRDILSVEFSKDCQQLIAKSFSSAIHRWDVATGNRLSEPVRGPQNLVQSAAILPGGNRMVWAYADNSVWVWDTNIAKVSLGPLPGHSDRITSLAFSSNGDWVVSGSLDMTIRIWDTMANPAVPLVPVSDVHTSHKYLSALSLAFSTDSSLIVSGHDDGSIWIWEVETGKAILGPLNGHSGPVWSVAFAPNGSLIASGGADGAACLWNTTSGQRVHEPMLSHANHMNSVAFSSDGRFLASGSTDNVVRIWNVETGKLEIGPLEGHLGAVNSVAFSPDCRHLLSIYYGGAYIWDITTGESILTFNKNVLGDMPVIAYSPDGLRIVSGSFDGMICIWDAQSGQLLSKLREESSTPVYYIKYSSNGDFIVSGSQRGIFYIWDAVTGHLIRKHFLGSQAAVEVLSVSPNNCYVASNGSGSGKICIMDASKSLRPDIPLRYVSGTGLSALPEYLAGEKLLVSNNELIDHLDTSMEGWITTPDKRLLFWLPHELRQADDSFMHIDFGGMQRRIVDFTKFVHGEKWTEVKAI